MKAIGVLFALVLAACTAKIDGGGATDMPPGPPPAPKPTEPTDRPASPAVQPLKLSTAGKSVLNTVDVRDAKPEETRAFTFSPEIDSKLQLTWAGTAWMGCKSDEEKSAFEVLVMDGERVSNGYHIGFNDVHAVYKGVQYRLQYKYTNPKSCKAYSLDFHAKYL